LERCGDIRSVSDLISCRPEGGGERDRALRELAVAQMRRFGARAELAKLYTDADPQLKPAVINAFFTAVADDELIHIADGI
jgi:hypothetical protein